MPKAEVVCVVCAKTAQRYPSILRDGLWRCSRKCVGIWQAGRSVKPTIEERFWSKVLKTETCWLWVGARNPAGYGKMSVNGKWVDAHRISWMLANGPIPDGLFVLHKCDTPSCIKPDDLFTGTQTDNQRDALKKGRFIVGERHFNAKLTTDEVLTIRRLYAHGIDQKMIADLLGWSTSLVGKVVNRNTWKHIPATT